MRLRRRAIICAGLLLLTLSVSSQNRTRGQVRNREGGPEPKCQIDFVWNQGPGLTYRVYSDQDGFFYLDDPNPGLYAVTVTQGDRSYPISKDVYIDKEGNLKPSVLVVPW